MRSQKLRSSNSNGASADIESIPALFGLSAAEASAAKRLRSSPKMKRPSSIALQPNGKQSIPEPSANPDPNDGIAISPEFQQPQNRFQNFQPLPVFYQQFQQFMPNFANLEFSQTFDEFGGDGSSMDPSMFSAGPHRPKNRMNHRFNHVIHRGSNQHSRPIRGPKRTHAMLDFNQVQRLVDVLEAPVEVHGYGNYPTLTVPLRDLIREVHRRLTETHGLNCTHVKLNGGAASNVLASHDQPYNDIDLIFGVDLSQPRHFELCKAAVLDALYEFLPPGTSRAKLGHAALKDAYVRKMVKVTDGDLWSLISLNNVYGRFVELKFVHMMRRQYEFSVDSFQVHLDAVLLLSPSASSASAAESESASPKAAPIAIPVPTGESQQPPAPVRSCPSPKDTESDPGYASDGGGSTDELAASFRRRLTLSGGSGSVAQREDGALSPSSDLPFAETPAELFPSVVVESLYGDIETAALHLRDKVIDTRNPEQIRGGGLLKYCKLLVHGYRPARPRQIRSLERYMCSRFFIDFPDVPEQAAKLEAYLDNHFQGDLDSKYEFLGLLHRIVSESTVCLMGHERRCTLDLISRIAYEVSVQMYYEQYPTPVPPMGGGGPKPSLLYLPPSAQCWIPVQGWELAGQEY